MAKVKPFKVWPSQSAIDRGWEEPDVFNWPGAAVHVGESGKGNTVVQFLLRKKDTGFLVLKTWNRDNLSTENPNDNEQPQSTGNAGDAPLAIEHTGNPVLGDTDVSKPPF